MGSFWFNIILMVHSLVGLAIVVLVLLQHGKGADMGASFGSGASGSLFGATGSANFLSRTTAALATVFFITSLGLTVLASRLGAPQAPASIVDKALSNQSAPVSAQSAPIDNSKSKDIPK